MAGRVTWLAKPLSGWSDSRAPATVEIFAELRKL
jgi:hypothetical protein